MMEPKSLADNIALSESLGFLHKAEKATEQKKCYILPINLILQRCFYSHCVAELAEQRVVRQREKSICLIWFTGDTFSSSSKLPVKLKSKSENFCNYLNYYL